MFNNTDLVNEQVNLRKFALRLTRNTANAEDLLQTTLLRALEKKEMFETGTSLFKWTSKMMFNLFVTEYRRKSRFETQYDPESYIDSLSVAPSQEAIVDLATVTRAMKRLTTEHQEILVLVCVKGLRYEEAAEMLALPVGTVRSRLSRARENLQGLLGICNDNTPAIALKKTPQQQQAA